MADATQSYGNIQESDVRSMRHDITVLDRRMRRVELIVYGDSDARIDGMVDMIRDMRAIVDDIDDWRSKLVWLGGLMATVGIGNIVWLIIAVVKTLMQP